MSEVGNGRGPAGAEDPGGVPSAGGAPAAARRNIGRHAVGGFAWLATETVCSKIVSTLAQIVLARLLVPESFGLFALIISILTFAEVGQRLGVREVLIRRHDEFDRLANAAFWLSAAMGAASFAVIAALVPALAALYGEEALPAPLLIAAFGTIFTSLSLTPAARLYIDFRYRLLATIRLTAAVIRFGGAIVMAWLGFGVYALIVPMVVGHMIVFSSVLIAARPPLRAAPQIGLWRGLLRDVSLLIGASLVSGIVNQGDYMILRFFAGNGVVGVYYIAFMLSVQPLLIISLNIGNVLMPTLSAIKDEPERQVQAFFKAARALSLIIAPICFVQAALAGPLVRLLFPEPFHAAAVPLAILCVGMAFRTVTGSSLHLINAQGRFGMRLRIAIVLALPFVIGAPLGAWLGGMVGMAIAVSATGAIGGILAPWIAMRPVGRPLRDTLRIHAPAMGVGLAGAAAAYAPSLVLPRSLGGDIAWLIIGGAVGAGVALGTAWIACPSITRDLAARIGPVAERAKRRLRPKRRAADA